MDELFLVVASKGHALAAVQGLLLVQSTVSRHRGSGVAVSGS